VGPADETSGHGDISTGVPAASGVAGGDSNASATRITPGNALRPEDIALEVRTGLAKPTDDVAEYALRLGDDALILAQRLGHWISRAPELEEDVALGNIALDQLGHARSFLSYAGGALGGDGGEKSEDDLAYFRREHEFRSASSQTETLPSPSPASLP
jgi:ring-1,2-phenylacetyl-CoA epoxidase subunit PaaC